MFDGSAASTISASRTFNIVALAGAAAASTALVGRLHLPPISCELPVVDVVYWRPCSGGRQMAPH